jgi:uncharacterized protein (TIGR03663 family)
MTYLPKPSRRDRIISLSILLAVLPFYFSMLSLKPPHADEGVNGFFVNQIWENGYFTYDPTNYHGPLLFYLFQVSEKIFGFGVHSFRIVTASFSVLTILLVLKSRDILGRYGSYFAALALAVSPGMIFFGRSAIHEPVFVFFQVLWIVGFLKLRERVGQHGLQWFLTGLLGCLLLKETFVILGIALLAAWVWVKVSPGMLGSVDRTAESPPKWESSGVTNAFVLKMIFLFVFIWLAFFTGFFHHRKGASDFFVALTPWLKTGVGGSGHDKPFYYWLQLFRQYEWVGAAGIAGAFMGIFSRSWKLRFLSFLALTNGLIYSLIPYKTPWCVISMLWPFVFVAGLWMEFVVDKVRPWNFTIFLLSVTAVALLIFRSAAVAYTLNFVQYADPAPYVYVQTKNDFKVLEAIIEKKIQLAPDARNMTIQVSLNESWPLPWFFSRFPNCRFGRPQDAFDLTSDIIFTEVTREDKELSDLYVRRKIDLRDAREPLNVYLKKSSFAGIDLPGFDSFGKAGDQGL